jgi:hypothetical protein
VTFQGLGFHDARFHNGDDHVRIGYRMCGNPVCRAQLFVVTDNGTNSILTSYPPETIDFDSSSLPPRVVAAFEAAIKCHAQQCFVAAAIMVRKTLEEVCEDQGAKGKNLQARIAALGTKVVLPKAMLDALDDLRLLGNDAAHLEARVYEAIGKAELEVAIDVAKEILKATYQYEDILGRLKALKKASASESAT